MHTRHSGRSSPLAFDPEIERTARSNRVARRRDNMDQFKEELVEDVINEHDEEVQVPQPVIPQLENNNNVTNQGHNGGSGNLQLNPRRDINYRDAELQQNQNDNQNGGNFGDWGYNNTDDDGKKE